MKLTIKNRVYVGLWFLFFFIVLLWLLSFVYINRLASVSKRIIKDNYESVESAKNMHTALDGIYNMQLNYFFNHDYRFDNDLYQKVLMSFDKNLRDEENNITETGEKEITHQLRVQFDNYKKMFNSIIVGTEHSDKLYFTELLPAFNELRNLINDITNVNLLAIIRKNNNAQQTSNRIFIYISVIGALSVLISLYFIYKFPEYIINPVKELTAGIKEIANKNYEQRLHFNSKDEFGEVANAFNVMANKLNEYEHSNLAEALYVKKRIETIINNMQDAIIGLNENRNILFANTTACKILGLKKKDILGKYAPDIAAQNDLLHNILKDLNPDGNIRDADEKELKPVKIFVDGKESYFAKENLKVTVNKTGEPKDYYIGNVIVLKNITRFKELDYAKTNFIATISHELKTPIASMKMSLKLIEDERVGNLNEEQQQLILNIRQEIERLTKITAELLDLAQVETGNIRFDFKPINPYDIIEYVCNTLRYQAELKGVTFKVVADKFLPRIHADMEKTAWVLVNLMTNAIRYSPDNSSIVIDAKIINNSIQFSVQDFGKGIESKYKDRIFEKFFLVPGTSHTGTGLGLAISKEFILEQKGKMWFESLYGKGSTFYFSLPLYNG